MMLETVRHIMPDLKHGQPVPLACNLRHLVEGRMRLPMTLHHDSVVLLGLHINAKQLGRANSASAIRSSFVNHLELSLT